MSTYCITFRIADLTVNDRTYDDRRSALIEAARAYDGGYWEETTSFLLAESDLTTGAFGATLAKTLSKKNDLLFVFDPSDMSASYFGAIESAEVLRSFFPLAKKLP